MTYEYAMNKHDLKRIDKLNQLTNKETFWNDVRKMVKNVHSDSALRHWQCFAEIRYAELTSEAL